MNPAITNLLQSVINDGSVLIITAAII